MKDYLHCSSAMNMDQGGSTTMWVKGQGVVSNPGHGLRNLANGLFVVESDV
jgi:exopolysaccharide biosynthesis protein